ncbi:DNA oxidative demethylase AlkB [Marinobacter salinexigens]|uniref:DNA oxidative demethylase AlkB n=1 Tax=Marinobacter salinexigens TaxID=2919747 RepID=A0A5B0V966_9GAMM|nr:DNA oxidative demethylase AlkB [Marinobacter salinexigens]KAA1170589.1 DNA oxidative demethylase AlkB [Marinobacter salinexigens]
MTLDLFDKLPSEPHFEAICEGAVVLRGAAVRDADALMGAVRRVIAESPLRRMKTPGGHTMSVAMTCCGQYGWVTDAQGYRYQSEDPVTGKPWPAMPEELLRLARETAARGGFPDFVPDACLINCYEPGSRMGLHQDKDEQDFSHPIVSVSLGLPQIFQFGGDARSDCPSKIPLQHGDVVVWGGAARLRYHGVLTLKHGHHPLTGAYRYNLTFRRAR